MHITKEQIKKINKKKRSDGGSYISIAFDIGIQYLNTDDMSALMNDYNKGSRKNLLSKKSSKTLSIK